ncbi:baculoviral IAP repeat-containing protein 1 [Lutra lutra]|uniref:baculoviral IAP repeat-containing protein 1 n=1 Tax=Lutra lutra TaxID=9657 RepID=UPI001FCFCAD5|nr:baculoviral IAP repeat-containing protein 1 [Lutra lutra]XP_047586359.1 baculoviral IAP repeat-containing protein 1 [Lutra lutra]XP_047586360.1 baculoviral IAP repeat-containing protein 1 [Lutra lutra]
MAAGEEASEESISLIPLALELSAVPRTAKSQKKWKRSKKNKTQEGFDSQMHSEATSLEFGALGPVPRMRAPGDGGAGLHCPGGVESGIQRFSRSSVLCGARLRRLPAEDHKHFHADCGFFLGSGVGNIAKYDKRVKNPENKLGGDKARYQEDRGKWNPPRTGHFPYKWYLQGTSRLLPLSL